MNSYFRAVSDIEKNFHVCQCLQGRFQQTFDHFSSMRKVRKAAARATGKRGYFSKKNLRADDFNLFATSISGDANNADQAEDFDSPADFANNEISQHYVEAAAVYGQDPRECWNTTANFRWQNNVDTIFQRPLIPEYPTLQRIYPHYFGPFTTDGLQSTWEFMGSTDVGEEMLKNHLTREHIQVRDGASFRSESDNMQRVKCTHARARAQAGDVHPFL